MGCAPVFHHPTREFLYNWNPTGIWCYYDNFISMNVVCVLKYIYVCLKSIHKLHNEEIGLHYYWSLINECTWRSEDNMLGSVLGMELTGSKCPWVSGPLILWIIIAFLRCANFQTFPIISFSFLPWIHFISQLYFFYKTVIDCSIFCPCEPHSIAEWLSPGLLFSLSKSSCSSYSQ